MLLIERMTKHSDKNTKWRVDRIKMVRGIKKQVKRRRVVCGLSSAKMCNSSPSRDENQEYCQG